MNWFLSIDSCLVDAAENGNLFTENAEDGTGIKQMKIFRWEIGRESNERVYIQ